jgi:hypothetical protein
MSRNQYLLRYGRVSAWMDILRDQLTLQDQLSDLTDQQMQYTVLFYARVTDLPVLMVHVPLHQRQHMWFMHDGAPPYFLRIVRQHLNQASNEPVDRTRRPSQLVCTIP